MLSVLVSCKNYYAKERKQSSPKRSYFIRGYDSVPSYRLLQLEIREELVNLRFENLLEQVLINYSTATV